MGKRTKLYTICLILFPVAFAGFVVGFGCPVWLANSASNQGLWQGCDNVFKNCYTLDFDDGGDWMIGVRAVEIFALVMLAVVAAELVYESCCTNFTGRKHAERLAPGVICAIGGLGGLAGIIVYAVKMDDVTDTNGLEYGWAFMLVAAGSGLAFLLGIGFCVSGMFMEKTTDPDKTPINAYLPSSQGGDSYVMSAYTNKGMMDDPADRGPRPSNNGLLPGHALYNGFARTSFSSPMDAPLQEPPYYHHRLTPAPTGEMKSMQYYSYSGEDGIPREFDLSEGYLPSRPRAPPADPYYSRGIGASSRAVEDPYLHRVEDPYSRGRRVDDDARGMGAGYLGSSRYFDGRGAGGRGYDAYDDKRESLYRSGRY